MFFPHSTCSTTSMTMTLGAARLQRRWSHSWVHEPGTTRHGYSSAVWPMLLQRQRPDAPDHACLIQGKTEIQWFQSRCTDPKRSWTNGGSYKPLKLGSVQSTLKPLKPQGSSPGWRIQTLVTWQYVWPAVLWVPLKTEERDTPCCYAVLVLYICSFTKARVCLSSALVSSTPHMEARQ